MWRDKRGPNSVPWTGANALTQPPEWLQGSSHLEGQQEQESFDAVEAAVHEVAHEQVVGLRAVASHLRSGSCTVQHPSSDCGTSTQMFQGHHAPNDS